MAGIKRGVVNVANWSSIDKGYKPIEYTSDFVLKGPEWADPNLRQTFAVIPFNSYDETSEVGLGPNAMPFDRGGS